MSLAVCSKRTTLEADAEKIKNSWKETFTFNNACMRTLKGQHFEKIEWGGGLYPCIILPIYKIYFLDIFKKTALCLYG